MEELQAQVLNAVIALLGVIASWALVSARQWFQQRVQNEYVQQLMLRLADGVEVGVRQVSQRVLPAVKAAAADGKLSPEEARDLRELAKEAAVDQLTQLDRQKLEKFFDKDQLQRKLDQLIEAQIHRMKENGHV
jgi:hypothetical protein